MACSAKTVIYHMYNIFMLFENPMCDMIDIKENI